MTLTEAAACATPAVATDIAGHRDAVVDGETGLLVRDDAELGSALAKVLSDDELRARLGRAARTARRAAHVASDRRGALLAPRRRGRTPPRTGSVLELLQEHDQVPGERARGARARARSTSPTRVVARLGDEDLDVLARAAPA